MPHRQVPCEQLSALLGSQAVHAPPIAPQVAREIVWQVAPEQQPLGQVLALQLLHTPLTQVSPPGQVTHGRPALPQAEAELPKQVLPEQQPVGHEAPSQTQAPPAQRCPAVHAGPDPQAQTPAAHPSDSSGSH